MHGAFVVARTRDLGRWPEGAANPGEKHGKPNGQQQQLNCSYVRVSQHNLFEVPDRVGEKALREVEAGAGVSVRERFGLGFLLPSKVVLLRLLLMGVRVLSGILESKDIMRSHTTRKKHDRVFYLSILRTNTCFVLCFRIVSINYFNTPSLEQGGPGGNPVADLHTAPPFQHPYTRKSTTTPSGANSVFAGLPLTTVVDLVYV